MKTFDKIINKVSENKKVNTNKYLNACDSLVEILYKKKQKLDRVQIINEMVKLRLIVDYKSVENFETEVPKESDQDKIVNKMWTTCKNGIDTAISQSSNNSSFHYNDKYKNLSLNPVGNKYEIVDRK